jgi:hypothetical protein
MSSSLGSCFPASLREDFSARQIEPGSVLRIHAANTTPPKTKRLVILAISNDTAYVGYLFINSEINPKCFPTPALINLHLPLQISGRTYLDHDSYLDCSEIKEISFTELKAILSDDPQKHIGKLSDSDFKQATNLVRSAPTISKKQKQKYRII